MRAAEARLILDSAITTLDERQSALQTFGLSGMDLAPTVPLRRDAAGAARSGQSGLDDPRGRRGRHPRRAGPRRGQVRRSRGGQGIDPPLVRLRPRGATARAVDAGVHRDDRAARRRAAVHERRRVGDPAHGRGNGRRPAGAPGDRARHARRSTGIWLQDVWRYARHFWSIPYQSTPGRNLFYLVRDAALPERPLIGIAALGNPVLGLAKRDDHFGWSANGLERRLPDLERAQAPRPCRPPVPGAAVPSRRRTAATSVSGRSVQGGRDDGRDAGGDRAPQRGRPPRQARRRRRGARRRLPVDP